MENEVQKSIEIYKEQLNFYFINDYIKNKNLKFALVLNHEKMQTKCLNILF